MSDNVNILMSVRNGERYLAEQIDSIQGQTVDGWHLSMRDDGSTDGTLRVLQEVRDSRSHAVRPVAGERDQRERGGKLCVAIELGARGIRNVRGPG